MRLPALLAAVLAVPLAPAGPAGPEGHEPRVVVEPYVAGAGDFFCFLIGFGCVRFLVQAGEDRVALRIDDDVHNPVAAQVCSPDCDTNQQVFCAEGSLAGLRAGDVVTVFLSEAGGPLFCGLGQVGAAVRGNVTATFP